ncbi:MAG: TraR/DksA family transcriptional regulator [Aquificota bacterium]|nr:MAG: TraR/DksA family transcriptional regulator [Aquificota bacterium]
MNKEKLAKFEQLLLEKKKQILERYLSQEEVIKKLQEEGLEIPQDRDDYAKIDNYEILLNELEEIEIKILKEIDKALERIHNGTYGICEVCGKPIEEKRLKAIPWTTLCIEHAKEAEKYKINPDKVYEDYLTESLIPYDDEQEEDVKQEGLDK